jgi:MFS transporter, DHA1 family, multidrug resistance protein
VTMTATATATDPGRPAQLGPAEFTTLLAMAIALTALGIDLMLPLFPAMRSDLGLPEGSTAVGGLVTTYFLGLAVGQLLYGPLADRFGRKPALYLGFAVYGVGALAAALSPSLSWLLAARFVWGFGAAGPRVITLAIVRDTFEGERMSRAMSSIMAVFILVPVVAPSLGAAIGGIIGWRWLFGFCLLASVAVTLWTRRLAETLAPEHRLELRFGRIGRAARFVTGNRTTVGYALALTVLYGSFISWLGSAELVFGEVFERPELFPVLFGGLAAVMGIAVFTNGRIVERVGLRRLGHGVLVAYLVAASVLVALSLGSGGRPPMWAFLLAMAPVLCSHALLIPNFNTIAMEPMKSVAGTASAFIGAVQIAGGALLGALLDRTFDGTVLPLSLGFLTLAIVAAGLIVWAERGRLFRPTSPPVTASPLMAQPRIGRP